MCFCKYFGNVKEPTIFRNNIFIMYRMDERHTIMAVGEPVTIRGNNDIVLLVKNRQLLYANALNAWLGSLEFYRDFAIPAYNQATRGTGQPIIPDTDIVAIADALLDPQARNHTQYLEALSFRAFRLFTIEMCIRAHTIEVRFVTSTQQIGVLAYVDDINLIPDNILNICIRKILYDNLLLRRARDTWFIATCDLYLDRPTGTRGMFHNDSNYYGGIDRVPGSEALEYLSLLLLLENNASLVRGTSIMSRLREGQNNQRVAISLPSMNGTNIIIHDNSFLHATPIPTLETQNRVEYLEQVSTGIGPRPFPSTSTTTVDVVHQPPIMSDNRRRVIGTELRRPKPRQFLRCHYFLNLGRLNNYNQAQQPRIMDLDFLEEIFRGADLDYTIFEPDTVRPINRTVTDREDLNLALRQLNLEGHTIGGKKTKKRNKKTKKRKTYRMRGGVDKDQSFIITSDKKDMYDVSKYNTGAELVIDMDNGLYIEINELNPVKK